MSSNKQFLQQPALATPNAQANAMPPQNQAAVTAPHQRMAQLAINNTSAEYETGSPIVDQRLGCDNVAPGAAGCVLTPAQRAYLIPTYQSRVTAAQSQYVAALIELGVDELLKKEPEQSDWVMELMIDVIGDLTLSSVMRAFKGLQGGAVDHLAHEVHDAHALAHAMQEETTEHVKAAVEHAVGLGKSAAIKGVEKQAEGAGEETTQRTANIAYLDYLKNQSATSYENLREVAPAGLSDTSFLVLFDSFRAENGHNIGAYKEALEGKLKRFEKSNVGTMGVSRNKVAEHDPMAAEMGIAGPRDYQTRAFWVVTPQGRHLALYRREAKQIDYEVGRGDPLGPRPASPLEAAELSIEDAQRPYTFVNYVPSEFEGAAISMHVAKYGADPYERVATPQEAFLAGGAT